MLTDDEFENSDVFGYDCEEDSESVSNLHEEMETLHDMLDKASDINVEEADTEMFCILPPHIRCASHTLNLIGSTDAEKIIANNPTLYKLYRSAISKITSIWNLVSRSTKASDTMVEVLGQRLPKPCATRWNSSYDCLTVFMSQDPKKIDS